MYAVTSLEFSILPVNSFIVILLLRMLKLMPVKCTIDILLNFLKKTSSIIVETGSYCCKAKIEFLTTLQHVTIISLNE